MLSSIQNRNYRLRSIRHLVIASALATTVISTAIAQAPVGAFTPKSIHDEIAYLASDALKGRDTGDPGNEMAARFIAAKFARDGLKPIGTSHERDASAPMDGSGYFQPFTFLAGHSVGKNTSLELHFSGSGPFNVLAPPDVTLHSSK